MPPISFCPTSPQTQASDSPPSLLSFSKWEGCGAFLGQQGHAGIAASFLEVGALQLTVPL